MKRRWKIAVASVAIVSIAAAIALTTGNSEPEYKGRTLSEWIASYDAVYDTAPTNPAVAKASAPAEALRKIGTNAVPTLVRWISYEESERSYRIKASFQPVADKVGMGPKFRRFIERGETRALRALTVFDVLGTNGAPAIPQLSNIVVTTQSDESARAALLALVYTGPAGINAMTAIIANTSNPHRPDALASLIHHNRDHQLIRDEANKRLHDPDWRVRHAATNLLQQLSDTY